jgi:ABC-type dipeptide/oligopeptide/nickel transport system permease subunit
MTEPVSAVVRRRRARVARRRRAHARGAGLVIGGLLAVIVLAVALAPLLTSHSPTDTSGDLLVGPGGAHLFGTDQLGRDVFSRTLYGGRSSLLAAVISVAMATVAGMVLGLVAGYSPPVISTMIMRAMDIVLGFPALLLALLILATVGSGLWPEAIAISISFVPIFTRVVYSSSISVREEGYVTAARVMGVRALTIVGRHIAPGVRTEVLVIMTSAFGWSILLNCTLSFLGLGAQPPDPDWGADLSNGQSYLVDGWWISVAPGAAITLTVLLVNLLGDHLATSLGASPAPAGSPTPTITAPGGS